MSKRIYSEDELPCYLSAKEVASYLGLGMTATYELIHRQDCPKINAGARILIPRDKFLKWLDQITEGVQ